MVEAETCSSRRITNVFLIYEFVYFVGGITKSKWIFSSKKNHTIPTGTPCSTDRIRYAPGVY